MIRKSFGQFSCLCALVLLFSLVGGVGRVAAAPACDPAYVKLTGGGFTVLPTGASDTANLQCAFDAAISAGPGKTIRLVEGAYHTAQIVVTGFQGTFSGAGLDKTIINNLPNLYVTPVDAYLEPPSAENPWWMLFYFGDVDMTMSDLAVKISGQHPMTPWSIYGIDPITQMAAPIGILGTHSHAEFDRVLVEGEHTDGQMFPYNVMNGIYYEGWGGGPDAIPLSGSFVVRNSILRKVDYATPVTNVTHASVIITHNVYDDVFSAADVNDLDQSSVEFSHNQVTGYIGMGVYPIYTTEDVGTTILVKNNVFRTQVGVSFEDSHIMGAGSRCLILGNNFQQVALVGVYLGPNTHDCTVVGNTKNTTVINLGTGNILTGINNMGGGPGPLIRHFLKKP